MASVSLAETVVILQIDLERLGIARRHIRARGIEWEILDARALWAAMVNAAAGYAPQALAHRPNSPRCFSL